MSFLAPTRLSEALELLADAPAGELEILAGGTDLWPKWTSGAPRPARVLSLHRLGAELRRIAREPDHRLRIGAACTHAELVGSPEVRAACPALAEAAATIGAMQIQNQGTIGGNVVNASPAADLPPVLAAVDAEVELCSRGGARRVPLVRFYTGYRAIDRHPDELVTALLVPPLPDGAHESFRKVGTRRAQAIAKVVGACRLARDPAGVVTGVGLAFGSVGPTVIRLTAVERFLLGKPLDGAALQGAEELAREAVTPIDDLRSSADYRRHVVGRIVHTFLSG